MTDATDLGNEVRETVRAILAKYNGKHEAIAGVKVSDLRRIDQVLNPEPETFEIPVRRDNRASAEVAIRHAKIRAEIDERTGWHEVAATIESHKAEGLREVEAVERMKSLYSETTGAAS